MSQTLDGLQLEHYAEDGFKPRTVPNDSRNYTLRGKLWIDYVNIRNGWDITFPILTYDQFQSLWAKYLKQYQQNTFLQFVDDDLGINTMVHLDMPSEHNLKWNKSTVHDLTITLEPESAIVV